MNLDELLKGTPPAYNPAWDTVAAHLAPIKHAPVGSKYTCSVGDAQDDDHLFLVGDQKDAALRLCKAGWELSAEEYDGSDFISLRFCDCNALVTDDQEFYDRFIRAAEVCKALDLSCKTDRITVHRAILYDENATVARKNAEAV